MNGDGLGSPPWGPADPVPDLSDLTGIQAMPGLGSGSGSGGPSGRRRPAGGGSAANGTRDAGAKGSNDSAASDGATTDGAATDGATTDGAATDSGAQGSGRAGDAGTAGPASGGKDRKRRSFWRELPVLVVVALVLALVIKAFAIQAFYIPSASMENTLEIGDRVLINKVVYHLRPIHRGDIIVFDGSGSWDLASPPASSNVFTKSVDELEGLVGITHDTSIYIKRVIGLPGDRVACCTAQGQVTVNGVPLSEGSYLFPGNAASTQKFSVKVPAGDLWVMGDHRLVSYDSRGHMGDPGGGSIPESAVLGRAFVIIWPPSRWGFLNIPATFEQPQLNASNAAAGGSSAALTAALDNGTQVHPASSPLPLALGFAGAVPVTWLQRRARRRLKSRRERRS